MARFMVAETGPGVRSGATRRKTQMVFFGMGARRNCRLRKLWNVARNDTLRLCCADWNEPNAASANHRAAKRAVLCCEPSDPTSTFLLLPCRLTDDVTLGQEPSHQSCRLALLVMSFQEK